MVLPTVLNFAEQAERNYITSLYNSLSTLNSVLQETQTVNKQIRNYFRSYSDIIAVYSQEYFSKKLGKLSVSNKSGFPMYSNVLDIILDKKHASAKKTLDTRDPKLITEDAISALMRKDYQAVQVFRDEFLKAHYRGMINNIKNFDELLSVQKDENALNIEKYTVDHASYLLSETTCVALSVELSKISTINPKSWKLPVDKIKKALPMDVDEAYEFLKSDFFYPSVIVKTYLNFSFFGKDISDEKIAKIISENPKSTVLKLSRKSLENLDVMLAQDMYSLKAADISDKNISESAIYICSEEIEGQLKDALMSRSESAKVVTI